MINLSMTQALDLWSDFVACYYGKHIFVFNTAEIYAYRLAQQHEPAGLQDEEVQAQVAKSLTEILRLFCERYDCTAEIPYKNRGGVVIDKDSGSVFPFGHRVHVTIRNSPGVNS